jgi:hypothetical protein
MLIVALVTFAQLFARHDATGAALVTDVRSGEVVASLKADRQVLPLSTIKLFVAAEWWKRRLGGSLDDMLVDGLDQPGKERALELRRRFGSQAVLDDLRELGLEELKLPPDADDDDWATALSIGEQHVMVTLAQVSKFLRETAAKSKKLQAAMLDCVARGTAKRASAMKGHLGGKTGSGPASKKPDYDGWFAGLVFDRGEPRYTIAVYVDGKGFGGGVATSIAAEMAQALAR